MTEPVDVSIQTALLARLQAANLGVVAYPYVPFTPTVGVSYYDARPVLRAAPQDISLAFVGSVIRRGIFQVDAVMPDGGGELPGMRMAALVVATFPQGLAIAAGTYKLQFLNEPTIAAAVKDAPWVRFPVSIPYFLVS